MRLLWDCYVVLSALICLWYEIVMRLLCCIECINMFMIWYVEGMTRDMLCDCYDIICVIWENPYKGSKIWIILLIEYLKARILFEIRITRQARLIMSSLNDSCWSNISTQEHLFEIRITPQARLIMSSSNDSRCSLNYIELQKKLSH